MAVQNGEFEVEDLDALAVSANSKSSLAAIRAAHTPPTPVYSFSAPTNRLNELVRIRSDCFEALKVSPGIYDDRAVCSGPYLQNDNGSTGISVTSSSNTLIGGVRTFRTSITKKAVSYVYPEPASGTGVVSVKMDLFNLPNVYAREFYDGTFNGQTQDYINSYPTRTLKFRIKTGGLSGRIFGDVVFSVEVSTGEPPNMVSLEGASLGLGSIISHTSRFLVFRFNGEVSGDTTIELIGRRTGSAKWFGASMGPLNDNPQGAPSISFSPFWASDGLAGSLIPAIHSTKPCFEAFSEAIPDSIGVFHPDGDDITEVVSDGSTQRLKGNQAGISITPSANIIGTGIWKYKTYPIGGLSLFDDATFLDKNRYDTTTATDTVGSLSQSVIYALGGYPSHRNTEPAGTNPLSIFRSCTIRDVFVSRVPAENSDNLFLCDTSQPQSVDLGCMRNGAFTSFQTVVIPADSRSVRITPFWPIMTANKLVYRSAEKAIVQASIMASGPGISPNITLPLLADHLNAADAMLNLLA